MKILHVVRNLEIGGMERVVLLLAEAQAAAGHNVTIVKVESTVGKTYPVPEHVFDLRGKRALWHSVFTSRPDVIHAHNLVALRAAWLMAKLRRVRLVFSKHGMHFPGGYCHWLMQQPDAVVAVSRPIAARYLEEYPKRKDKCFCIPNGTIAPVDAPEKEQARSNLKIVNHVVVVLWVGRMVCEKGLDVLIEAWRQAALSNAILLLVGDGPERQRLEEQSKELELCVRFEGSQEDISTYYAVADVLVMPSRTEGLPMALLEAGMAGLPAIVSDVGEMPEIVEKSGGGWVVGPNAVNALEKVLRCVCESTADDLRDHGARLQEYICKHYSMQRMSDDYEKVYEQRVPLEQGSTGQRA